MCLAVPGRIVETTDEAALVDFQGNRQRVDTTLTPSVHAGQWVLVHAGFAITTISESDALETWEYLRGAERGAILDEAGGGQPLRDETEAADE
jgi:hydrogenase expression/formation protein HypC